MIIRIRINYNDFYNILGLFFTKYSVHIKEIINSAATLISNNNIIVLKKWNIFIDENCTSNV